LLKIHAVKNRNRDVFGSYLDITLKSGHG